jgi:uncharacterized UPF0146 family protein
MEPLYIVQTYTASSKRNDELGLYNLKFLDTETQSVVIDFIFQDIHPLSTRERHKFIKDFIQNKECEIRIHDDLLIFSERETPDYCILDINNKNKSLIIKLLKNETLIRAIFNLLV